MTLAPICLFTYNRLSQTKQTILALSQNHLATESVLFIFSDGAKNTESEKSVKEIRLFLSTIQGFKTVRIFESPVNKGLAESIISGVTIMLERFDKIIVLEDDLVTAPNFLYFMNQALNFYRDEPKVQSISGYSLAISDKNKEVYFQTRPGSWGWATWKDRWNPEIFRNEFIRKELVSRKTILSEFRTQCGDDIPRMLLDSLTGKNNSWYVRWTFNHFINNRYSVYPTFSLVENIGFGLEGTHCKNINTYISDPEISGKKSFNFPRFELPDKKIQIDFLKYFSRTHKITFRLRMLKTALGRKMVAAELKNRLGLAK